MLLATPPTFAPHQQGTIKKMIDQIIEKRSKGASFLVGVTRTKLLLKGVNPDKYTFESPDDPVVIEKLRALSRELGLYISLN